MKTILETVFVSCPDSYFPTPWGVSCEAEGEACCKIRIQETNDTNLGMA